MKIWRTKHHCQYFRLPRLAPVWVKWLRRDLSGYYEGMIAPTIGTSALSLHFRRDVACHCARSIGVAGVGGGGTPAALIVLSTLNFPALRWSRAFIAIEPISYTRTALER